jgi:hypothetical protein
MAISKQPSRASDTMKAGGKRCPQSSPEGQEHSRIRMPLPHHTVVLRWTAAAADKVAEAGGSQGYLRARGPGGHGQPAAAPPTHA